MDEAGGIYERHRTIVFEKPVEGWFAVTNYEAEPIERPHFTSAADDDDKKPTKAERAAEKKREAETTMRYSLNVTFDDLVNKLEFAMMERMFGEEAGRLLRLLIKRVVDARTLSYKLGAPPEPARNEPARPLILERTSKTIQ